MAARENATPADTTAAPITILTSVGVNSTRKTYPIAMTIAPEANVAFAPHRLVTFDDTGANPIIRTPPGIIASPASAAESPRPSADATGD